MSRMSGGGSGVGRVLTLDELRHHLGIAGAARGALLHGQLCGRDHEPGGHGHERREGNYVHVDHCGSRLRGDSADDMHVTRVAPLTEIGLVSRCATLYVRE